VKPRHRLTLKSGREKMKAKHAVFNLIALGVTAVNAYVAANGVLALVLEGDAREKASWAAFFVLFIYGRPAGGLALASLLFLPLLELKWGRIIGWWLFINGIFPFAAGAAFKLCYGN